jgi:hypothetical protein
MGWAALKTGLFGSNKEIRELTEDGPVSEETERKFKERLGVKKTTPDMPMQPNIDVSFNADDIKKISSNKAILKTDAEKMPAEIFVASHNILKELKNSKIVIIGIATAIVIIVGLFVWPTRYRYDHLTEEKNIYPIRIDRLTGRTEIFYGKWISTEESTPAPQEEDLPPSALDKLSGRASITSYGWINCDIYNGSNWILSEVTVVVTVKKLNGAEILSRKYLLTRESYESGEPLKSSKFHTGLGFELKKGETFSWGILSAKGRKKS